jgi:phosphoserine phosphatase RsbU/P
MAVLVLAGTCLIFGVIFGIGYLNSRDTMLRNVETGTRDIALRTVNRIESILAPVEKIPVNLSAVLENLSFSQAQLIDTLHQTLVHNLEIFGMAVAFEPAAFDPSWFYFAPYVSRKGTGMETSFFGSDGYNYFHHDWYQIPRETETAWWSEPYFNEGGGNLLMATFSQPLYRKNQERRGLVGVITADISLDWLEQIISGLHVYKSGYAFILSQNGAFISYPDKRWIMNESIFSIAEASGDADLRAIGKRMTKGLSGFIPIREFSTKVPGFLYFAPIGVSKWSLGIFFPKDEMMADVSAFNRQVLYLAAAGIVLLALMVWLVSQSITRPLTSLSKTALEMATGNLDVTVPHPKHTDEVGVLADALIYMRDSLKIHIENLLKTTAAKERIESELSIARDIQMGLLPKESQMFPDMARVDLYAFLQPAREVGGDLYDFHPIDDSRICFILGDVSGKGVPAALFMAVTMTLIKMTAAKGFTPDRILSEVNRQLCSDNPSCMFVTLFCGIMDIQTGEVWYANGGHTPPVIIRTSARVELLEGTEGVVLGAVEDFKYEMKKITLAAGEHLLIYSDGVTEAMNGQNDLYSEERLLSSLGIFECQSSKTLVENVMADVGSFAGDAPQADDITLLAIRYRG